MKFSVGSYRKFQGEKARKFLKFWNSFRRPHAYAYTHDAQNFCVGVIFDCEQDGPKKISNSNFFVFLGIRFETHHTESTKMFTLWILNWLMTSKNTSMTSWRPHMRSNRSSQIQNIIETDFILTKENNNLATRMEPRISAGDFQMIFIPSPISRDMHQKLTW